MELVEKGGFRLVSGSAQALVSNKRKKQVNRKRKKKKKKKKGKK